MKRKSNQSVIAAFSVLTAFTCTALAQTTWNGSSSGSWATGSNWTGGIPDSADLVTYGAGSGVGTAVSNATQTLDGSYAVLGFSVGNDAASPIIINNGTGSNTLTIGASGILLNSGTGGSFGCDVDIIMSAAQSFTTGTARSITVNNVANGGFLLTVNTAGSTSTTAVNGELSGAGGLTKSGPGTMTLSGTANTFSGQVTVAGGTLNITKLATVGNNSTLGTGNTASSIVLNGGSLAYSGAGGDTTNRAIDMRAGAAINNNSTTGAISFTAGNVIQGGATASARTLSLGGANSGDNTFNSILGDSGTGANISSLQKNGTGKWIVTGTQLYTGSTIINAGTLSVSGSTVLGGASGNLGTGNAAVFNNIVFGLNLDSGRLEFATNANLGAASQVCFRNTGGTAGSGGALVYVGTTAQTVSKAIQSDTSIGVRLSSESVGGSIEFSGSWANVTSSRPIYLEGTGAGNNTISGSINANGSGSLTKRDSGTWVLSGNNTYTGSTNINGGTLIAGSTGALANSPVNLAGGILASTVNGTVATTGTLSLSGGVTSKIDFGGGTTVLSFANSSAATWTGTLQILNWTGNISGGGADQLVFASAGLDGTKISLVTFVDPNGVSGNFGAQFVGNELVPVPEPSPLMIGLGLLGMALYRRSRV
jgi:fibronectin-binding autotransporter adhesin